MQNNNRTIPDWVFFVMISAILVTSVISLVVGVVQAREPRETRNLASAGGSSDLANALLPGGATRPPVTVTTDTDNADHFWQFGSAAEEGLIPEGVDGYVELCRRTGADAVLVAHGRTIVGEWYSPRYNGSLYAMSSTKSVTGLLVGIAQDQGALAVTDRVGEYIDSWNTGLRGRVTIENLLTQTSGLLNRSSGQSVGGVAEKNEFVIGLEPDVEPGTQFSYSNEGVQLLSPILERAIGDRLDAFARTNLFIPLGMNHTSLHVSGTDRSVWTYADMETTPRDFARLGRLVLSGGRWNDTRIVSSEYLDDAFAPSAQADNYGYLWWRFVGDADVAGVASLGYLSTDMYILTDYDVVIVRMQAPRSVYTGASEDAPYSQARSATLLRVMVGLDRPEAAATALSGVPDRD